MNHRLTLASLLVSLLFTFNVHAAAEVKEWNFLVFINGVNNLDRFGKMNINQMEEVGSNENMNILVQWGSYSNPNVQRLLIQKDNDTNNVTSPVVQNLGSADMGDYNELVRFIEWSHQNYPAKHYFVAIWNHGSGWHLTRDGVSIKDISYDDRTGHHMTTEQVGVAMEMGAKAIGHKIDIYGSDACLMGMAEVADEMSTSVNYFVGSQDLEPGEGWPYSTFLGKWAANPSLTPAQVSVLLSKEYLASYSSGGIYGQNDVTMSAYDLGQFGRYKNAVKNLGAELAQLSAADMAKVKTAAGRSKYFTNSDYRDVVDFVNQMKTSSINLASTTELMAAHQSFVIANDQNVDNKSFGLSIWLPTSASTFSTYWNRYQGLAFQKATDWGSFVKKMVGR